MDISEKLIFIYARGKTARSIKQLAIIELIEQKRQLLA